MNTASPAILVVEDNEDNRYTLTRRLRREGYDNIAVAEHGRAALEMLHATRFDLVLLDIMMPEVSGYEVLERMKGTPALRDIPVLMISALDEIDSVVRCIELGAEDYLTKPFNPTLLRARIAACLEKKRLRDQEALYLAQLEQERRRSDALLNAILPAGAVAELKKTDNVKPRRFENVAVLFCDIVAFTPYCERHDPEHVVANLQSLVGRFETIVAGNGLEKIKTVGDAFMATAGLLQPVDQPVLAAARCGLAMVEAAGREAPHWAVHVGIHVGPVVAGVVGTQKFLYDLWGDTVNVAARITEHAVPGSVCLSEEAWRHIAAAGQGTDLGPFELKGKGLARLIRLDSVAQAPPRIDAAGPGI